MRTTVDIDADLLKRLRHEALRRRIPLRQLLAQLLREGLDTSAAARKRYRCPTFSMGQPMESSVDQALALAGALEDAEIARRLRQGT